MARHLLLSDEQNPHPECQLVHDGSLERNKLMAEHARSGWNLPARSNN